MWKTFLSLKLSPPNNPFAYFLVFFNLFPFLGLERWLNGKSIWFSCIGPRLNFQHSHQVVHGHLLIPVPGNLTPFVVWSLRTRVCTWRNTHIQTQAHIREIKINKSLFPFLNATEHSNINKWIFHSKRAESKLFTNHSVMNEDHLYAYCWNSQGNLIENRKQLKSLRVCVVQRMTSGDPAFGWVQAVER